VWSQPVGAHLHVCTATQIAGYYTQCQSSTATTTGCSAWDSANTACHSCLYSTYTASRWGALVAGPSGNAYVNVGGCIALAEPCNAACGQALAAVEGCDDVACGTCASATYNACLSSADTCGACLGFDTASACRSSLMSSEHPAFADCWGSATSPTFQQLYTNVATFMCGP
jgi:hypothetical protein